MNRILFLLLSLIAVASCSELNRTKDDLTQNAQVYAEDAFRTIEYAKSFNQRNRDIHERSVAQITFPKAVKGSFIFGGNYAEGYLIESEQIVHQIRMIGGNIFFRSAAMLPVVNFAYEGAKQTLGKSMASRVGDVTNDSLVPLLPAAIGGAAASSDIGGDLLLDQYRRTTGTNIPR